ncbi:MAG TPA: PHP domain-containing protein, partial [Solirubrobacterales bacterium]
MPISFSVRATRMAISPRLAMRTFWNTAAQSIYLGRRGREQLGCAVVLVELQSHSTVSDGQLPPAEVVEKAAEAGVTTLALTDHDAIAGVV